jgi:hypothetical protein
MPGELRVTRHASQLFDLPDRTPVLAHWHGQYRTDGFATTVGELKAKAKESDMDEARDGKQQHERRQNSGRHGRGGMERIAE